MTRNKKTVWMAAASAALLAVTSAPVRAGDAVESLYKTKCSACHGADGKGQTPAGKNTGVRDFASPDVKKASDDELSRIIAEGKGKMPSYKKSLKPDQVKSLVAYIRALEKK